MLPQVYGAHTVAAYSRIGLTGLFVTINFDINRTVFKIPLKKAFNFIDFTGDLFYMIVPGKILVYGDA